METIKTIKNEFFSLGLSSLCLSLFDHIYALSNQLTAILKYVLKHTKDNLNCQLLCLLF